MFKKSPFLILSIIILLCLQLLPFFYYSSQTPKDRVYLGAERYAPDYYSLLSYISLGTLGKTSAVDLYTNEPHQGSLVHAEYLIFGKAGSFFNLPPQVTYYISRTVLLTIFISVSYWFIGLFIKNKIVRNMTLLLSFFWDGSIINAPNFYQLPNLFNRLTFEPHKLIGMVLTALVLYTLSQKKKIFLTIVLSFLIGFIHGTSALTLGLAIIIYILISRKLRSNLIISMIFLALPLLYWQYVFSNNIVWNQIFSTWEKYYSQIDMAAPPIPIIISYLLTLGPLLLLSIIGLKKFISTKTSLGLLTISYIISHIFLFFAGFILLQTSRIRFYQTPYLLFLSIMAVFGIITLTEKIKFKNKTMLTVIVISLLILQSIPNSISSLKTTLAQFGPKNNLDFIAYPPKKWYKALDWLNTTPPDSVVLCLLNAGQILPGISGRRVVVGHFGASYNYYQKLPLAQKFFKGQMTLSEAKAYLQKERVNYVFYGLEEKSYGTLDKYSQILKPVFENEDANIYKVTL